jgi:hypothetical protein
METLLKTLAGIAAALTLFSTSGSVMAAGVYTLTDVGSCEENGVEPSFFGAKELRFDPIFYYQ